MIEKTGTQADETNTGAEDKRVGSGLGEKRPAKRGGGKRDLARLKWAAKNGQAAKEQGGCEESGNPKPNYRVEPTTGVTRVA